MLPNMNFILIYVQFLQLVGVFSFFLLCIPAQNGNRTRYHFDWLGLSMLFFFLAILSQFLISIDLTYLILIYVYKISLLISFVLYSVFLFISSQGKSERNAMGLFIILFVVLTVAHYVFYPIDVFLQIFLISYPLFCAFTFHFLGQWSLRIQIEKRGLIIFWSWSIKLFFIFYAWLSFISRSNRYIPETIRPQILFYSQIIWLVLILIMNESFWNMIVWIRGLKTLSRNILVKSLYVLLLLLGFLVVFRYSPSFNICLFLLVYSSLNFPLLFYMFHFLQGADTTKQRIQLEREYRHFSEFNPIAVGLLDDSGVVESLNPSGQNIFGCSEKEVLGKRFDELIGKSNDQDWLKTILSTTSKKQSMQFSIDLPSQKKGKKRNMKIILYPLSIEDYLNNHFVFSMIDDTEIKEKVTTKDQLIGLVSYELRTPLTVISESVQLLKKYEERQDTKELRIQILDIASRNIEKMSSRIEQILKMEKISNGKFPYKFSRNNIHKLIRSLVADFQAIAANKNVSFILKLESRKEEIVFDEIGITEVLSNLINNAINNTSAGTITIGTSGSPNEINVYVQDTGDGISEDKLSKIFEPFSPGLGLSICKTIIHDHNGQIYVESKLGKGSRFLFSLPG